MRWVSIALASSTLAACGGSSPPSPPVVGDPTATIETINGTERIGWDQPAADASELATIRYAIYVDGTRTELTAVSCASAAAANGFPCTARLPALSAGAHTLQIASFVNDGSVLESARSVALRVSVVTAVAPATTAPAIRPATIRTSDGVTARVDLVADGLEAPADLAFAPDGRLFVAERRGRIRIVRDGRLVAEPAIALDAILGGDCQLIALALDPQFARTRFVYVIYASPSRTGDVRFAIARLREASDTFADPVVVLDGVPASASPAAALRFGPDGKLYAALDAGDDARRSGDAASLSGKVLRLNADGTTPADSAGSTPVFASGFNKPVGLAWHPASRALWVAERGADGAAQLRAIAPPIAAASTAGDKRVVAYALPADTAPTALAFGGGDRFAEMANSLFVASAGAARLLRLRFDPQTARPAGTEWLLQDVADGVRGVAIAPDGAIYFITSNSLGRIVRDVR